MDNTKYLWLGTSQVPMTVVRGGVTCTPVSSYKEECAERGDKGKANALQKQACVSTGKGRGGGGRLLPQSWEDPIYISIYIYTVI